MKKEENNKFLGKYEKPAGTVVTTNINDGEKPKTFFYANGTMPKEVAVHYNDFIVREGLNKLFDEMQEAKQSGKELSDEKKKAMHNERIVSKLKKMPEQKSVRYDERAQ